MKYNQLPFPCPLCGGRTYVRINYTGKAGVIRYRECKDHGRFVTHQNGRAETFDHWTGEADAGRPTEPAEIEPLELPPLTPRQVLIERFEHLRLVAIWRRGEPANGCRPQRMRAGGNGYELEAETAFYQE